MDLPWRKLFYYKFALYHEICKNLSHLTEVLCGAPGTTRTCGQPLRRRLLYPLSYRRIIIYVFLLKRVMGIEPTQSAWKADVLPLNYTRIFYLKSLSARRLLILYKFIIHLSTHFQKLFYVTIKR